MSSTIANYLEDYYKQKAEKEFVRTRVGHARIVEHVRDDLARRRALRQEQMLLQQEQYARDHRSLQAMLSQVECARKRSAPKNPLIMSAPPRPPPGRIYKQREEAGMNRRAAQRYAKAKRLDFGKPRDKEEQVKSVRPGVRQVSEDFRESEKAKTARLDAIEALRARHRRLTVENPDRERRRAQRVVAEAEKKRMEEEQHIKEDEERAKKNAATRKEWMAKKTQQHKQERTREEIARQLSGQTNTEKQLQRLALHQSWLNRKKSEAISKQREKRARRDSLDIDGPGSQAPGVLSPGGAGYRARSQSMVITSTGKQRSLSSVSIPGTPPGRLRSFSRSPGVRKGPHSRIDAHGRPMSAMAAPGRQPVGEVEDLERQEAAVRMLMNELDPSLDQPSSENAAHESNEHPQGRLRSASMHMIHDSVSNQLRSQISTDVRKGIRQDSVRKNVDMQFRDQMFRGLWQEENQERRASAPPLTVAALDSADEGANESAQEEAPAVPAVHIIHSGGAAAAPKEDETSQSNATSTAVPAPTGPSESEPPQPPSVDPVLPVSAEAKSDEAVLEADGIMPVDVIAAALASIAADDDGIEDRASDSAVDKPVLKRVIALYDYEATDPESEASFKEGDVLDVSEEHEDGWWLGRVTSTGNEGYFPSNYVKSSE